MKTVAKLNFCSTPRSQSIVQQDLKSDMERIAHAILKSRHLLSQAELTILKDSPILTWHSNQNSLSIRYVCSKVSTSQNPSAQMIENIELTQERHPKLNH
jgi:hypothetical protein